MHDRTTTHPGYPLRHLYRLLACAALPTLFSGTVIAQAAASPGAQAYAKYCAACHDQPAARTPPREALAQLSPQRILQTMDFGLMMSVAYPMRRDEREAVADFLGKGSDDLQPPPARPVRGKATHHVRPDASQLDRLEPFGRAIRDSRPRQTPGSPRRSSGSCDSSGPIGFPGDVIAFAAPTILHGTLFVGSAGGTDAGTRRAHRLHPLDATGRHGPVRTPPTVVDDDGRRVLLFTDQIGGVYALDARDGREIWKTSVEAHEATRLTGAIAVHEGIAFVPAASWEEARAVDPAYPCCTFRGSVTAVRVRDGSVAWKTWLVDPPVQDRRLRGRHGPVRTLRRRRLVGADHRCRARTALRGDGQRLHASRDPAQRRDRRARYQERAHRLERARSLQRTSSTPSARAAAPRIADRTTTSPHR